MSLTPLQIDELAAMIATAREVAGNNSHLASLEADLGRLFTKRVKGFDAERFRAACCGRSLKERG